MDAYHGQPMTLGKPVTLRSPPRSIIRPTSTPPRLRICIWASKPIKRAHPLRQDGT
jgi:hypothetical protein